MSKTQSLSLGTRIAARDRQVACEVSGELVMLSLDTGVYYGMNPVAARIWNLIQSETTVEAIRDQILSEYADVTSEQCTEDLFDVLGQLIDWGLVEVG